MSRQRADFQEVARQAKHDLRANRHVGITSGSLRHRGTVPREAGGRWSCFVIRVPVSQGLLEVFLDGLEDHAVHQFLGFCQADPADLGQFLLVADKHVRPVGRLGGHVDHGAAGVRVNAAADNSASLDAQARFLLDLPHGGIGRALAGLDLARYEGPRRFAVPALAYKDTQVAGNNRRDYGTRLGHGGRLSFQLRVHSSCRDDLVSEGLADPKPLGDLAERQFFSVVDPDRFFVEDSRCVLRDSTEALGEPDGSVGAILRTGHGADASSGGAASFQRGVNLKLNVFHTPSVQSLIVQVVDAIVHPLYVRGSDKGPSGSHPAEARSTDL
jgi:hypothetical protein